VIVRRATLGDLDAVCAIYNHEVANTVATFDTEPRRGADAAAWFTAHDNDTHPLFVAEHGGEIAGWSCLSQWSPRGAYARTTEGSVFVRSDRRSAGVGAALLDAIVAAARAAGHRVVLGRIEASNEASRRMLRRAGFATVGVMHAVGEKFGRVLDVEVLELVLDATAVAGSASTGGPATP
jgi:phosphinothricin acetyltransferase